MKQIELELKKRLLIVEDVENGTYFPPRDIDYHIEKADEIWKLICKGSELTEEILEGLVEKDDINGFREDFVNGCAYLNYKTNTYVYTEKFKALESFISAIVAKGYYWSENPCKKELDKCNEYTDMFTIAKRTRAFEEAESRTFNPENTLIFEIL